MMGSPRLAVASAADGRDGGDKPVPTIASTP